MNNLKRLISDALLVSFVGVISTLVYLEYELGFMTAFGITQSLSTVPISIQSVLPVFVALLIICGFVFVLTTLIAMRIKKLGSGMQRVILGTTTFLIAMPLIVTMLFIDNNILHKALIILVTLVFYLTLVFSPIGFLKIPPSDKTEAPEKLKKEIIIQLILLPVAFILLIMPLYAFSFGYFDAISQSNFYITTRADGDYIVVKQFDREMILEKIVNDQLYPKVSIQYLDSSNPMNFELKQLKLDFNKVQIYRFDSGSGVNFLGY